MAETAPAHRAVVEIQDLHKYYGALEVLKGVSLSASQGDVISLIGSSGSGKSTLLRCINLLETPTSGRIAIDGEEIMLRSDRWGRTVPAKQGQITRIRAQLGMVFQNFNLWPHMTVLENVVEAPLRVLKKPRGETVALAESLLEKVGLASKRDAYPAFLSGGQQQRVAIARALAMQPKVMLFDEPTSALDPELVGEVLKVIATLATEGRTMILVTHEMAFARDVSNEVIFLHNGLIEEAGSPKKVFGSPTSERCRRFVGEEVRRAYHL